MIGKKLYLQRQIPNAASKVTRNYVDSVYLQVTCQSGVTEAVTLVQRVTTVAQVVEMIRAGVT